MFCELGCHGLSVEGSLILRSCVPFRSGLHSQEVLRKGYGLKRLGLIFCLVTLGCERVPVDLGESPPSGQEWVGPAPRWIRWSPQSDRIVYEQGGRLFLGMGPTLNDGYALTGSGTYQHPHWSADGSMIVYDYASDPLHPANLWIRSAEDAFVPRRLTNARVRDYMPCWSRDGGWIAFHSRRSPANHVWVVRPEGGDPRPVGPALANERSLDWSPTGARLAYEAFEGGSSDIWVADMKDFSTRRLAGTLASDKQPRWLPDGSGVGFLSLASKGWNVWIQEDLPDVLPQQVTRVGNVVLFDWLQEGKALMFLTADGKLYAQRADPNAEPVYLRDVYDFAVSPDGRRYVYVLYIDPAYKRYVEPVPSEFLP